MGRLLAFMAASPARRRWAREPRRPETEWTQPRAAPGQGRRNLLSLDAIRSRSRISPTQAPSRQPPSISTPAPDESAESRAPFSHCRGSPPSAARSRPSHPEYRPANPPPASVALLLCCYSAQHSAACSCLLQTTSLPHPDASAEMRERPLHLPAHMPARASAPPASAPSATGRYLHDRNRAPPSVLYGAIPASRCKLC